MKFYFFALIVWRKLWPIAVEVVHMAEDGVVTKNEICAAADRLLGEDDVVHLWKPNA